jgi:dienelactone hydrolase
MKPLVWFLLPMFCFLFACHSGTGGPVMEPGGCGLEPYNWLSPYEVGELLSYEEDVANRYDAATMDSFAAMAGPNIPPARYGSQVFMVRYTTQDKGKLVEATGMVAVPWNDGGSQKTFPTILYLHGTCGWADACAPSLIKGPTLLIVVQLISAQGFVVVAPDYIGMDAAALPPADRHAYMAIEQTAIGSLDMLPAARTLLEEEERTMALPEEDIYLVGYSQGGHAVFAVDRVAPYYVPQVRIRAAVAGIPATDLTALAKSDLSSLHEGTMFSLARLVAHHDWYEAAESLESIFTSPFADEWPLTMETTCSGDVSLQASTVTDLVQADFLDMVMSDRWDELGTLGCSLQENSITRSPVQRLRKNPTYFVMGEADDLVPPASQRADFETLCAQGHRLQHLECAGATHDDTALWAIPEVFTWLLARVAGEPLDDQDLCRLNQPVRCLGQPD